MSSSPRCATCIHWTRGAFNPQRGECDRRRLLKWVSTRTDAGWGCPEHKAPTVKRQRRTKTPAELKTENRDLRREVKHLRAQVARLTKGETA